MTGRIYDKTLEVCITALLVLTPLALGSVFGWTYRLVAALAFVLLGLWLYKAGRKKGFTYTRSPFPYFLPAAAAFVFLQAVPLPASLVHALSPGRDALDAAAGFSGRFESISLYPWAAVDKGVFVVCLAVYFLLVLGHPWTKETVSRLAYIVIGLGTLFAAAFLVRASDRAVERHFLPYINKNHFAGYIEVALTLAVAAIVYRMPGKAGERRVKGFFRKLMGGEFLNSMTLLVVCAALMFAALVGCVSRGGLMGLGAGLLVIVVMSYGNRKRAAIVPVLVMALVVTGLSLVDTGKLSRRLGRLADVTEDRSAMLRLGIWKDTAEMVKGFPAAGVGIGSYETAYQYYKSVRKYTIIFQPESDYLYVLAEGGLAGLLLAGAFAALVLAGLYRVHRGADDPRVSGMAVGALAALAALLVHGFVDTNLHIPANVFLVTVLAAAALSLGTARVGGRQSPGASGFVTVHLRGGLKRGAVYASACLVFLIAVYAAAGAAADLHFMSAMHEKKALAKAGTADSGYYVSGYEDIIRHMEWSETFDPGRIDYPFEKAAAYNSLGRLAEKLGSEKADDMGMLTSSEYYDLALRGFRQAERVNPYNSFSHLLAGRALEDGLVDRAAGEAEYLTAERLNPTHRLIKQVLIAFYRKTGDAGEAHRREVALAEYDPDNNPVKITSLTPDTPENSAYAGDRVTWTAVASVVAGSLEYKFCLRNRDGGVLEEMTGYTPSGSWAWDTSGYEPGRYRVVVRVRGAGGMARERSMAYEDGFVLRPRR